ncbi:MAG: NAD(P)H-binding protein [Actinomycetota bacterium]|nr:NAD(P)H-binding protein [Actinomycetota bacterium]
MILVTGASGAIGSGLVETLLSSGRKLRVASRSPRKLEQRWQGVDAVQLDVQDPSTLPRALEGIDAAYYLVHSMEDEAESDFATRDAKGARTFALAARLAGVERVIYLGGLGEDRAGLSEHLRSRQQTGRILAEEGPPLLEFRAAIVISAESASFRMLTDLVRRLPAMVLPKWTTTSSQPIGEADVLAYLEAGLDVGLPEHHTVVEIGGSDVLTYRDMIERVAAKLERHPVLVNVPLLTPTLSSYWTGLTTSVPAAVARPLIEGSRTPMVVRSDAARTMFPQIRPGSFDEAVRQAL